MKSAKILIVVASKIEIEPLLKMLVFVEKKTNNLSSYNYRNKKIDILITGIGSTETAYHLTKTLISEKYDFCINAGICGSFKNKLKIGEVVNIIQDEFADVGIADKHDFFTLFDMNFIEKDEFPFKNSVLVNEKSINFNIKKVKAITVNSTSGNIEQIEKRIKKFNPDTESMEGATFFYICKSENIQSLQIRAVSNYIEERNKNNWNIELAVNNLASFLEKNIFTKF